MCGAASAPFASSPRGVNAKVDCPYRAVNSLDGICQVRGQCAHRLRRTRASDKRYQGRFGHWRAGGSLRFGSARSRNAGPVAADGQLATPRPTSLPSGRTPVSGWRS